MIKLGERCLVPQHLLSGGAGDGCLGSVFQLELRTSKGGVEAPIKLGLSLYEDDECRQILGCFNPYRTVWPDPQDDLIWRVGVTYSHSYLASRLPANGDMLVHHFTLCGPCEHQDPNEECTKNPLSSSGPKYGLTIHIGAGEHHAGQRPCGGGSTFPTHGGAPASEGRRAAQRQCSSARKPRAAEVDTKGCRVMALDMQSQRIRFDPHSGSPQTIDTHFDFPTNVKPVPPPQAFLNGFNIGFTGREHPIFRQEINISPPRITEANRRVIVVRGTFALRDSSGHYDDEYDGFIDVGVIVERE